LFSFAHDISAILAHSHWNLSPLSHQSSKTQTISRMASVPFRFWKYVHLFL